ncbi:MAG: hypothetical protein FD130_751 [Halothiobacillaceae bacterium]|nr:MAG: hypothetical protein FD130_751 [Halothiobacillaceae bacterium]
MTIYILTRDLMCVFGRGPSGHPGIAYRSSGLAVPVLCFLVTAYMLSSASISNALFLEYEDVSQRKRVLNKCPLTSDEIRELLNAFYSVCSWIPIYYLWRPNLTDEGDNFLIELALAGNATHIITNNIADLINAELNFPHLNIVKPQQMLRGK